MSEPSQHDLANHAEQEDVPVCLKCFTPYKPPQHYCEACGETVGQLSPYIPFVNIPFFVSIFATMWKRTWSARGTTLRRKAIYLVMFAVLAPVLILALPFTLIAKYRIRSKNNDAN